MSFDLNTQYAQRDALRSELSQLRSAGDAIQTKIDGVTALRNLATVCDAAWMHVETTTLFLHDVVLEDSLTSDARAADPLEAMRTYLNSAQVQIQGVMSDEFDIDVSRKRLTMAIALADTTLELLSGYLDALDARQRR